MTAEQKNTGFCSEVLLPVSESADDGSGGNGWVCRSLPGAGIFSGREIRMHFFRT